MRYKIHSPRIAHETIDDETVLIDFDNGVYFSTTGTGAAILDWLAVGLTRDEVMEAMSRHFSGDPSVMGIALDDFIRQLEAEALILPTDAAPPSQLSASPEAPSPFSPPVLEKYTDMQELLLLDPIHEVNEQGWPYKETNV